MTWYSCVTSHLKLSYLKFPSRIKNVTTRGWQELEKNQHPGTEKGCRTSKYQTKTTMIRTPKIIYFSNSILAIPINFYTFSSVSCLSLWFNIFPSVLHWKISKRKVERIIQCVCPPPKILQSTSCYSLYHISIYLSMPLFIHQAILCFRCISK